MDILRRPRRNRKNSVLRRSLSETHLDCSHLVYPLFIKKEGAPEKINSMPGIFRFSIEEILKEIEDCINLGLHSFALFPYLDPNQRDKTATASFNENLFYLKAIEKIKNRFAENVMIISDVAMDPYSSDGHDGLVSNGKILNDETLEILGKMALAQAKVGVDMIGPSDMMDGRVGYLREVLDKNGFMDVGIMSYTAKYASSFYGPFREALESTPQQGDKKTYQMNPSNIKEALVEAELDFAEGADVMMVKPGLAYLDVIYLLSQSFEIPIAAFNVSGEYSMVKAAAANGWIDGDKIINECLMSFRRAGASMIFSYFSKEWAQNK